MVLIEWKYICRAVLYIKRVYNGKGKKELKRRKLTVSGGLHAKLQQQR